MIHFTLRFDNEELHQTFKIKAITENTNIQQQIMKMIEEWTKEDKK